MLEIRGAKRNGLVTGATLRLNGMILLKRRFQTLKLQMTDAFGSALKTTTHSFTLQLFVSTELDIKIARLLTKSNKVSLVLQDSL